MLRALSAFHCTVDGVARFVPAGQVVRADDPVVAGRESLFADASAADDQPTRRRPGKSRS